MILINFSNLQKGGGLQVASSLVKEHLLLGHEISEKVHFILSSSIYKYLNSSNILSETLDYSVINVSVSSLRTRTKAIKKLDEIERKIQPGVVVTLFGPSYWKPKCPNHIMGYAIPHYIFPDSPYFKIIGLKETVKTLLKKAYHRYYFKRDATVFTVETEVAKVNLSKRFNIPESSINVISNTYHQIYLNKNEWVPLNFPVKKEGEIWLLAIGASYRHKNFEIIPSVIASLRNNGVTNFKFILTQEPPTDLEAHALVKDHVIYLGAINIAQCPMLFQQSDYLFLPTLLECFSASYAEAMISKLPILTSDLDFARDICKEAAVYFNPLMPEDIADKIIALNNDKDKQKILIANGLKRVVEFDNASQRYKKTIELAKKFL